MRKWHCRFQIVRKVLETGSVVLSGTGQELLESDEIQKAYLGG